MTNGKRILIVEDDRFLRRACEASLQQRGFDVITAVDGEQGLELAVREKPDAILLDLLMPRRPGIEVLRALKAETSTAAIPVLILSNSSREEDKRLAMELGAVAYCVKANLSLRELAEELTRLLEG
jgi:two-component system alkaline phosphatase synthesis response regulator PhoP